MSKDPENSVAESKNYKLMAKIYRAICECSNEKSIKKLHEEYDINYRIPENAILKLCKPELIGLSVVDFLIEEKVEMYVDWDYESEIMAVLLNKGADFTSKNNEGLTILHRIMRDDHYFNWYSKTDCASSKLDNKKVHDILSMHVKTNNSSNPRNEHGISHFHVACMANHVEAVEFFLDNGISFNEIVSLESPQYPGYTALHFAVRFYSLEVVDVLLKRGANLRVKDAKGTLPLHLLVQLGIECTSSVNEYLMKYDYDMFKTIEKMIDLFLKKENEDFEVNNVDDYGFSLLHAACAMTDTSMIKCYLEKGCDVNAAVGLDSPMWPGYTALHFAAHFKSDASKLLIENGGDIGIKDAKGVTPFDLIATRSKITDIHNILSDHPTWKSIILSDGKTKSIDLVRAMQGILQLDDFLDYTNLDVNVIVPSDSPLWPGNSPLHLAILFSESHEIGICRSDTIDLPDHVVTYLDKIKLLLRRGADVNAENHEGTSPCKLAHELKRECVVSCLKEMFPDLDTPTEFSDTDRVVTQDKYRDFQDLLFNLEIEPNERDDFIDAPDPNVDHQRLERDFGLTLLHVACWRLDVDRAEDLVTSANVNAQLHVDLPVWAGCTPLHILLKKSTRHLENDERIDRIFQLLLDNGADVTLTNARLSTAVHATELDEELNRLFLHDSFHSYATSPYTGLLLQRLKDFSTNPVNKHGISHFHIACMRNDVAIIEKFLEHGVDVNEPIDLFSDRLAGRPPLHLAMEPGPFTDDSSRTRTMNLLMSHGADLFAEDSRGNTLLHAAAKSNQPREGLLERLISLGLDIDSMNSRGDTPLECLLLSKDFSIEELQVFTKRGRRLHTFNPITQKGYLTAIFRKYAWDQAEHVVKQGKLFKALTEIERINEVYDSGRTLIHNVVSDYIYLHVPGLIDELVDRGYDIDHRDDSGRTALDVAADLYSNVNTLLSAGADVNVVDENGESTFSRCLNRYKSIKPSFDYYIDTGNQTTEWGNNDRLPWHIRVFVDHVKMMIHCGRHVSDHIANTLEEAETLKEHFLKLGNLYEWESDVEDRKSLYQQIEKTKGVKFGSISLYDFLSESRALRACRSASSADHDAINEFFLDGEKSMRNEFDKVFYMAKRLYKNTSARLSSINAAKGVFCKLLGFLVPDLCDEAIFRFLSNKDLENLIVSST